MSEEKKTDYKNIKKIITGQKSLNMTINNSLIVIDKLTYKNELLLV